MKETIRNTIEVKCTPETLYSYVTQPWLWHEWHPNSKSAKAKNNVLSRGDEFNEEIELQPLSPLPLHLRRKTIYRVLVAEPNKHWCVEGNMSGGWLRINYEFEPTPSGVSFTRTLDYETKGINKLLAPLLRPRMRSMSRVALENLKNKVENDALGH